MFQKFTIKHRLSYYIVLKNYIKNYTKRFPNSATKCNWMKQDPRITRKRMAYKLMRLYLFANKKSYDFNENGIENKSKSIAVMQGKLVIQNTCTSMLDNSFPCLA